MIICQVCDRSLHRMATASGVSFAHSPIDPDDHPVAPVEAPPHWRGRCDFCTTATAQFIVPASDFTAPNTPAAHSLGDWAACPTCALMIGANRWNILLRRSLSAHEHLHGTTATAKQEHNLRAVHRTLRAAINGPIRPIPPAPIPPDEPAMRFEQARIVVHQRLYGTEPPPYREPGSELGAQRLERDCLRLAAMPPEEFAADPDAVATALEIAEQLRWDS
ncbi:hypothetical protein [Alloactinosynnema sp. L-07]|nr:hypothetical protein [Alloactinosynnema sp. L-07]